MVNTKPGLSVNYFANKNMQSSSLKKSFDMLTLILFKLKYQSIKMQSFFSSVTDGITRKNKDTANVNIENLRKRQKTSKSDVFLRNVFGHQFHA